MKILVIENDNKKLKTILAALKDQFIIESSQTAEDAQDLLESGLYAAIIIDTDLLGRNGLHLCKTIRSADSRTPILMMSSRHSISEKILALDAGADDFLSFPVEMLELLAHIRALIRRTQTVQVSQIITIEDLSLNRTNKTVMRGSSQIHLRRKEFEMLEYFMCNKGKVITRQMLLNNIWISTFDSYTNTVDVHVKYLRDRIDKPFPKKLIKTIYGFGYKLEA